MTPERLWQLKELKAEWLKKKKTMYVIHFADRDFKIVADEGDFHMKSRGRRWEFCDGDNVVHGTYPLSISWTILSAS